MLVDSLILTSSINFIRIIHKYVCNVCMPICEHSQAFIAFARQSKHLFLSSFTPFATIVSHSYGIGKRWQAFALHLQYIRKEMSRDDRCENIRYLFTISGRVHCEFQIYIFAVFASIFAYVWEQHCSRVFYGYYAHNLMLVHCGRSLKTPLDKKSDYVTWQSGIFDCSLKPLQNCISDWGLIML